MKTVAFHNLGCKVNTYELDAMVELFENRGYEVTSFEEKADVYVVNTCSVTNIADRKSRQMLSRARKLNPAAIVVAVGCYVETREEELLKTEKINLCIGNNKKSQIVEILEEYLDKHEPETKIVKMEENDIYDDLSITGTNEHTRAFIKIQDGCNQFCTYCIIPFARGRVRSRAKEDILKEIGGLVENGYHEFVITGIHISSYGADFIYEKQKADQFAPRLFLELLTEISNIEGVWRIRLGSLEPRIITEDFAEALSQIKGICPHFHLSLQSGSQTVLERMNRHYGAEEYFEKTCILRKYFEHPAITTDIIVGFPGETEQEFNESLAFAKKCNFYEIHIFKYSKRQGTIAAGMKGQLTEKQKTSRAHELEKLEKEMTQAYRDSFIDGETEILLEEEKDIEGSRYWVGFNKEYVKIAVLSENLTAARSGELKRVHILGRLGEEYMLGTL